MIIFVHFIPGMFERPALLVAPDDPELAHVPGGGDGQQVPVPLPAHQQERPGLEIILESEHSLKQCCHELFKPFEIDYLLWTKCCICIH